MGKNFNRWPLFSLLAVAAVFAILAGYTTTKYNTGRSIAAADAKQAALSTAPAAVALALSTSTASTTITKESLYPDRKPMIIKDVMVEASVAKNWPDRIAGLSDTPFLPPEVVKLFVFDSPALHSIWMKDMNYAIDILWVTEDKKITYIVNDASPESYPELFTSEQPAVYVIEAAAGFVSDHDISVGDTVTLPLAY